MLAGHRHFELLGSPFWGIFPPLTVCNRKLVLWVLYNFKNHKFWVPRHHDKSSNSHKIGQNSLKKMPKNCRLSFHPKLILTQQNSIPIIKFEVLGAYEEVSAKIAMWGSPLGTCWKWVGKNFRVAWRIRKGPDPKIFGVIWERVWAPLQATQENFWFMLNHG